VSGPVTAGAPGDAPLPTRRELRRLAQEAEARGEGPLTPDELFARALAERQQTTPAEAAEPAAATSVPAAQAAEPAEAATVPAAPAAVPAGVPPRPVLPPATAGIPN
jgi:phosphatidate cytidylyltransferase